ncbi:M23 family metallopeptidase [Oceanobacillus bengalensis]|uniref:M23 family metallopeptidase n=2 Tax=Oceanobacillus bengalensis TaxID=1435466 RepID=A0A494YYE1_9BACI|nr:M23 family metallopeptidase [Oceanobacillus bengalensis]
MRKMTKFGFVKTIAMTTCLGLGLTINTAYAEEVSNLETIFHVYVDGEHIGKVNNQDIAENIMTDKLDEAKENYENTNLIIGEDIDLISEKVFNPSYNNDKVAEALKQEVTVMADVFELKIADETIGYFHDKESADEVIRLYKMKYVDEAILEEIEVDKQQDDVSLEPGETLVKDVILSEGVSINKGKSLPSEVMSIEQGITLLEKGTLEEKVHTVQEGEVLGAIAGSYDLSTDRLFDLNPELTKDSVIQIGQEINVMDYKPFVHVIVKEEKRAKETIPYETEIIESDDLYKGEEEVRQEGQDGTKEVLYAIEKVNGKQTKKDIIEGNIESEAVKKVIVKGTKVIPSRGTGEFSWPAVGGYISSHVGERWGRMHKGIDIARPSNRNILAADNGVVESAGYLGGFGNRIVINHNNGMKTIYAHLSSIDVSVGQTVEKGKKIGIMGSTGNSTGIHLHFELYKDGVLQNPLDYL